MRFSQIIGHDNLKKLLADSVDTSRISHAQLFNEIAGSGAYPLALAYASYIMCRNKTNGDSCGQCPECFKNDRLQHPDVHFIFPVNDAKSSGTDKPTSSKYITQWREYITECQGYPNISNWYQRLGIVNKQGIIRKEEASELLSKLSLKSFEGGYKIIILYQPETMNDQAANSLLKLIEEPPAKTLFLLVSDAADKIIGTIISRSQQLRVPLISDTLIEENLISRLDIDPKIVARIAHSANGSWGKAVEIAKESQDAEIYEAFVSLMRLCYTSNYLGIFEWVDGIVTSGREFHKSFCYTSIEILRNCYVKGIGIDKLNFALPEQQQFVERFAPYVNHFTIEKFIGEYELLLRDLTQNGNSKIIFTHFALTLCKIFAQAKQQLAANK